MFTLSTLKKNWFNLALLLLLAAAWLYPENGSPGGPLAPGITRSLGVILIFFTTGLSLRTPELRAGLSNGRLHAFVQAFGFVFVPAIVLLGTRLAGDVLTPEIQQGLLVLAIMPTTITSCVVYTTLARGNVAGAVFNSILGNLGGVVLSPLLFALLIAPGAGIEINWVQLGSIGTLIVIPLLAGLLARGALRARMPGAWTYLPYLSGLSLLLIVYFAFCSAFSPESPLWSWSGAELAMPLMSVFLLHLFFLSSAWVLGGMAKLSEADRRAAVFIAPQKTVALGLPLVHFFYSSQPELAGLMSIPLILYHPLQLFVAGLLASRLAERPGANPPPSSVYP